VNFSDNRPSAATLAGLGAGAAPLAAGIAASTADGNVSLNLKVPATFSASVFHKVNDKMDVMADATWTEWSVFEQLQVLRSGGIVVQTVPEKWKDTWRVAVGGNYHYNEQWTSRIGVAVDQTPVSDTYRTPRIPDGNRTWLAVGGQYKANKDSAVDFGYAHLFVSDSAINQDMSASGAGALIGTFKNSVDILSIQYSQSF
jgi:long-chain fatty acid transport protein